MTLSILAEDITSGVEIRD